MEPFFGSSSVNPLTGAGTTRWSDEACMARGLELSWEAAGLAHPNPMVGAVVVNCGDVVGEGYHSRCGEAHAEVIALNRAGDRARGATLYVTLEPCAHHGRTPPCVDRIIESGVKRVVIPTPDPDEKVSGAGVAKLRAAGITVDTGCLEAAALTSNLDYYKDRLGMGSTVLLKMAVTLDGKIASAPGRRDTITGEDSRKYVHRLRANSDGVVVGIGTVRTDDPGLDCRVAECGSQPVPVVFDSGFSLSPENRWAAAGREFFVAGVGAVGPDRRGALESAGGRVIACARGRDGRVDPVDAVRRLAGAGVTRLLVEGGADVFAGFLDSGCWDAIFVFQSSRVFGPGAVDVIARDASVDALAVDSVRLGDDFLFRYLNRSLAGRIKKRLAGMAGR